MSAARDKMVTALNDWMVPHLMEKGFKGTFPTFRRFSPDCVHLITFQFTAFDSAFCVNIAKCCPEGITFKLGEYIPSNCASAHHCPEKLRLGVTAKQSSHWFKYNPTQHEIKMKDKFPFMTMYPESMFKYKHVVDDIIYLLDSQGESWWMESDDWWLHRTPEYNRLLFSIQNCVDAVVLN